jgi:hypothetical protein
MNEVIPAKVICPHCGGHNCFHEKQEVDWDNPTKKLLESFLCTDCGYTTTNLNLVDSEIIQGYEQTTAELIKALRWIDPQTNLVWYPIVLNFPSSGIIFPDGTSVDDWSWRAAPAVDIPQEEQKKYPIPGNEGAYYTKRIDMEAGKLFGKNDFYEACKFIGFIQ